VGRLVGQPLVGGGQLVVHTRELTALVGQVAQQPLAAPLQPDRVERVAADHVVQHHQRHAEERGEHTQTLQSGVAGVEERPRRHADERDEEREVEVASPGGDDAADGAGGAGEQCEQQHELHIAVARHPWAHAEQPTDGRQRDRDEQLGGARRAVVVATHVVAVHREQGDRGGRDRGDHPPAQAGRRRVVAQQGTDEQGERQQQERGRCQVGGNHGQRSLTKERHRGLHRLVHACVRQRSCPFLARAHAGHVEVSSAVLARHLTWP